MILMYNNINYKMIRFSLKTCIKIMVIVNSFNNKLIRFILYKFDVYFHNSEDYSNLDFQYHSPNLIKIQKNKELDIPLSFKGFLNIRSFHAQKARLNTAEWYLNSKSISLRFVELLNLNLPKTYQNGVLAKDLIIKDKSVIKPLQGTGSRNVFIVYNEDQILDLYRNSYCSRKEMLNILKSQNSKYFNQELITSWGDEVRDYKFFSFYGEVSIVLEVSRTPIVRYCCWNDKNEIIDIGRYSEKEKFHGRGIKLSHMQYVKKISKSIPAPFLRIDFLHSAKDDKLYFCEFTPRPGGYVNFNKDIDILLGHEFAKAESRLFNDLLNGKKFKEYQDLL